MPPGQQLEKRMRISCKRCQDRKIKCSRTSPCQRCAGAGVHCEFRGDGLKRPPISREYVAGLENKIAALEVFLLDLKSASGSGKEKMIASIEFPDHLAPAITSLPGSDFDMYIWNLAKRRVWRRDAEGLLGYHGPSSIYTSELLFPPNTLSPIPQTLPVSPTFPDNLSVHDTAILECLANFFHWNQPHSSFIDWDSFLSQYMDNDSSGGNCSPCLVFAMSSLGALMSSKDYVRNLADRFFESAVTLMKDGGLLTPCLTSIQTLLYCSYFELGRGNVSKGWMYSGMAHSMAQNLGLQQDDIEMTGYEIGCTPQDTKLRRRTFTNCFISDKIISLQLGRPPVLILRDTDIKPEQLESPSTKWELWLSQHGFLDGRAGKFLSNSPSTSKQQIDLAVIIQDMLSHLWTEVSFNDLTTRFWRWLNTLPASCRWDRWGSNLDPVYPNVAALHMLYHTALISLNRPFLASGAGDTRNLSTRPAKILSDATSTCEASADTILSILHRFKAQYGLRVVPLSFVHGTIIAIEVTVGTSKVSFESRPATEDAALRALDAALEDMSHTWELAGHARKGLQNLLAKRQSGQCQGVPKSLPAKDQPTPTLSETSEAEDFCASYIPTEFRNTGFDADALDMLPVGAFDAIDSYYWPVDGMVAEGDEGSQRIAFPNPEMCLSNE